MANEYQDGDFCRASCCPAITILTNANVLPEPLQNTAVQEAVAQCTFCPARRFYDWLLTNNYQILKKEESCNTK